MLPWSPTAILRLVELSGHCQNRLRMLEVLAARATA